jgi:nucleoside 2-deoxyribosyltransferase
MSKPIIYVASSWKNAAKLGAVHALIEELGCEGWDFRKNGFWWKDVDPHYLRSPHDFLKAPQSQSAFRFDKEGLDKAHALIAIMPAGISTALEVGYAAGREIPTLVWGEPREERFDIMWSLAAELMPSSVPLGTAVAAVCKAAFIMSGQDVNDEISG